MKREGIRDLLHLNPISSSFENGAAAFQGKGRADYAARQQRIEFLETEIHVERDLKLEEARRQRQLRRLAA